MKVAFIHPDLGLGGAERLVIDCALALKSLGHDVTIYTSFLDPHRCFPEVHPDHPQIPVHVIGPTIPRSIYGRFHAALAAIRCAYIASSIAVHCIVDVVICDIVALPLLVLKIARIPSVFYCHFPDKELVKTLKCDTGGSARNLYRIAVDGFEELGLRCAGSIVCNSKYTRDVFVKSFPKLELPRIVYPCISEPLSRKWKEKHQQDCVFLSINRYERKKNIELAIDAFATMLQSHANSNARLIVAGGYDTRLAENISYYDELVEKSNRLGIQNQVTFLRNLTENEKEELLEKATGVIYTPTGEHFGIVPLEAMVRRTPVIAANSGGPVEIIQHGQTGYLCNPKPDDFAKAMHSLHQDHDQAAQMGEQAHEHVMRNFSMKSLAFSLQNAIDKATQ